MSQKAETLRDGKVIELKDLYSAEQQLLKAIPKMIKKAANSSLKKGLESHLKETEGQVERLDKISEILDEKLTGQTCKAMKGLIEEGSEILEMKSENVAVIDALLIGAARRIEHYEIAAYCTTRAMASELGEKEIEKLLGETFDEESNADDSLKSVLTDEVLEEANENGEEEVETQEEHEDEEESSRPRLGKATDRSQQNRGAMQAKKK